MNDNKKVGSWELLDIFWSIWRNIDPDNPNNNTRKLSEYLRDETPSLDLKYSWTFEIALGKFVFELGFLTHKPIRNTVKHLYGSHGELYDVWGCEKHKVLIKSSDNSYDCVQNGTIFCPLCNEKKFYKPLEDYSYPWWRVTDCEWESRMKIAEIYNKDIPKGE